MSIIKKSISGDFDEYVIDFIKDGEGFRSEIYLDTPTTAIPTIGYGFSLAKNDIGSMVVRSDLATALSQSSISYTTAQTGAISSLVSVINSGGVSEGYSDGQSFLADAYEEDPDGEGPETDGELVGFTINETQATALLSYALEVNLQTVRNRTTTIKDVNGDTVAIGAIFSNFEISHAGSEELAALYSMIYAVPALYGQGLASALDAGDRARAWFEMLYHHNNYNDLGQMNRRESEADLFGLVNAGATSGEILDELNTLFNGKAYSGVNIYDTINLRDDKKPFLAKISSYLSSVQNEYTEGNAIHFIQVADGSWIEPGGTLIAKSADGFGESGTNNLLMGSSQNEKFNGLGGDDYFYGYGGADSFYFSGEHGNDVIVDFDKGNDSLYIASNLVTDLRNAGIKSEAVGGDQVITTSDGNTIRLIGNALDDDPTSTGNGGAMPREYEFDENGNPKPNPNKGGNNGGDQDTWMAGPSQSFGTAEAQASPLVLDLDGTGINLTELGSAGNVYWNVNPDKPFSYQSAWISAGTGLLSLDSNENGYI